jgi:hypothetical protein
VYRTVLRFLVNMPVNIINTPKIADSTIAFIA